MKEKHKRLMYVIKEYNNCATDNEENKFTIFNKIFEDYK